MDDDEPKQVKSNTGFEHNPKDMRRGDRALKGAVGNEHQRQPSGPTPAPGGGGRGSGNRPTPLDTGPTKAQTPKQEAPDNRPVAARTGDQEVDAHYGKTHRLVDPQSMESSRALAREARRAPQPLGPRKELRAPSAPGRGAPPRKPPGETPRRPAPDFNKMPRKSTTMEFNKRGGPGSPTRDQGAPKRSR